MIASSIHTTDQIGKYPEAIQKAIHYLKEQDFMAMEPGVYEIQGKEIYAQVFDTETGTHETRRPEVHRKFLDVQYLVSGEERIGFTVDTGQYVIDEYIEERDLIFYKEVENEGVIEVRPGCYSIFFPEDVHRPGVAVSEPMMIRKVVVKVSVSLL